MKDALKKIAPVVRALDFRGSGQNYRKVDGYFVFVINFQGSKYGDDFFINLGAQPTFIPAEGDCDLSKIKEYECVFRRRVGESWPWEMDDHAFEILKADLIKAQGLFFSHVKTLPDSIKTNTANELIVKFSFSTTNARSSLHLARSAAYFGCFDMANELVNIGLELAGEKAVILRKELKQVIQGCQID